MSKAMLYFLCLKSAFKIRNALNEDNDLSILLALLVRALEPLNQ
jgi:hypothetical protein